MDFFLVDPLKPQTNMCCFGEWWVFFLGFPFNTTNNHVLFWGMVDFFLAPPLKPQTKRTTLVVFGNGGITLGFPLKTTNKHVLLRGMVDFFLVDPLKPQTNMCCFGEWWVFFLGFPFNTTNKRQSGAFQGRAAHLAMKPPRLTESQLRLNAHLEGHNCGRARRMGEGGLKNCDRNELE